MVPVQGDHDHAKLHADEHGIRKQRRHFAGPRVGRDIVVVRLAAHLQIAHATADPIGRASMLTQPAHHHDGALPQRHRAHGRLPVPAASCARSTAVASRSWTSRGD